MRMDELTFSRRFNLARVQRTTLHEGRRVARYACWVGILTLFMSRTPVWSGSIFDENNWIWLRVPSPRSAAFGIRG
jgi:hypothetical protein